MRNGMREGDIVAMVPYEAVIPSFAIPTEEGGSVIYSTADDADDGTCASPASTPAVRVDPLWTRI